MKKILRLLTFVTILTAIGTGGFYIIEKDWTLLDSLYMTVITLATVGYQEVKPLSENGKVFVIVFLVMGMGLFYYSVVQVGQAILEAQFKNWLEKRKMDKALRKIQGHFVVAGCGRMGSTVCREFAAKQLPFVVIDRDGEALALAREQGWTSYLGDATDDETLQNAGIERARGLASVLPSDSDNVYVVLTARMLSPDLHIIARASEEKVIDKLERAGADRIVSTYQAIAAKVAHLLVNPNVEDFLEIVKTGGTEVDLAEVLVVEEAPFAGLTLAQTDFRHRGIIVVGIRRPDGRLLLPPASGDVIEVGDMMIVAGKAAGVSELMVQS